MATSCSSTAQNSPSQSTEWQLEFFFLAGIQEVMPSDKQEVMLSGKQKSGTWMPSRP
jgi:hypothetical protein